MIAVKSARDQHTPPMTFGTSRRATDFFELSLGVKIDDISASFEAYCLSGVSGTSNRTDALPLIASDTRTGLVERSVDVIQGLQGRVATVIMQKLGEWLVVLRCICKIDR